MVPYLVMTKKYTDEALTEAVKANKTMSGVMIQLGITYSSGSMHTNLKRRIADLKLDTTHMVSGEGWAKGLLARNRKTAEQILVRIDSRREQAARLRRALIEIGRKYCCTLCQISAEWRGAPLVLQVDHIDGDWRNNDPGNLRFLCPNCHSQTPNYYRSKKSS